MSIAKLENIATDNPHSRSYLRGNPDTFFQVFNTPQSSLWGFLEPPLLKGVWGGGFIK